MATGLRNDTRAGIDQDDGQVGRRTAGNHVTRVLLVSRRVGNDEFAFVGREVAVSHVDGNALFAFGLESVAQQCIVNLSGTGVTYACRVAFEGRELVFVEFF